MVDAKTNAAEVLLRDSPGIPGDQPLTSILARKSPSQTLGIVPFEATVVADENDGQLGTVGENRPIHQGSSTQLEGQSIVSANEAIIAVTNSAPNCKDLMIVKIAQTSKKRAVASIHDDSGDVSTGTKRRKSYVRSRTNNHQKILPIPNEMVNTSGPSLDGDDENHGAPAAGLVPNYVSDEDETESSPPRKKVAGSTSPNLRCQELAFPSSEKKTSEADIDDIDVTLTKAETIQSRDKLGCEKGDGEEEQQQQQQQQEEKEEQRFTNEQRLQIEEKNRNEEDHEEDHEEVDETSTDAGRMSIKQLAEKNPLDTSAVQKLVCEDDDQGVTETQRVESQVQHNGMETADTKGTKVESYQKDRIPNDALISQLKSQSYALELLKLRLSSQVDRLDSRQQRSLSSAQQQESLPTEGEEDAEKNRTDIVLKQAEEQRQQMQQSVEEKTAEIRELSNKLYAIEEDNNSLRSKLSLSNNENAKVAKEATCLRAEMDSLRETSIERISEIQGRLQTSIKQCKGLEEERDELVRKLKSVKTVYETKLRTEVQSLASLNSTREARSVEIVQSLRKALAAKTSEVQRVSNERNFLRGQMNTFQESFLSQVNAIEEKAKLENEKLSSKLAKESESWNEEVSELSRRLDSSKLENARLKAEWKQLMDQYQSEVGVLRDDLEAKDEEVLVSKRKISEIEMELAELSTWNKLYESDIEDLKEQRQEVSCSHKKELELLASESSSKDVQISDLQFAKTKLEADKEVYKKSLQESRQALSNIQRQLHEVTGLASEREMKLTTEASILKGRIESLQEENQSLSRRLDEQILTMRSTASKHSLDIEELKDQLERKNEVLHEKHIEIRSIMRLRDDLQEKVKQLELRNDHCEEILLSSENKEELRLLRKELEAYKRREIAFRLDPPKSPDHASVPPKSSDHASVRGDGELPWFRRPRVHQIVFSVFLFAGYLSRRTDTSTSSSLKGERAIAIVPFLVRPSTEGRQAETFLPYFEAENDFALVLANPRLEHHAEPAIGPATDAWSFDDTAGKLQDSISAELAKRIPNFSSIEQRLESPLKSPISFGESSTAMALWSPIAFQEAPERLIHDNEESTATCVVFEGTTAPVWNTTSDDDNAASLRNVAADSLLVATLNYVATTFRAFEEGGVEEGSETSNHADSLRPMLVSDKRSTRINAPQHFREALRCQLDSVEDYWCYGMLTLA